MRGPVVFGREAPVVDLAQPRHPVGIHGRRIARGSADVQDRDSAAFEPAGITAAQAALRAGFHSEVTVLDHAAGFPGGNTTVPCSAAGDGAS